jgi:aminotransferase
MRAILDPGDEVIMSDPCYVAYMPCTVLAGGVAVRVPTSVENEFKISAAAIESKITDRTKAILLGYPSNPTGAVLSREELLEIAAVAARHDLLVISDEIYDRLVYEGTHTCFTSLPGTKDRTILIGGFSKDYAMTGWRIGYTAANAEILEAMMKIHQYTVMCAPIISQMAAIEALRCGEDSVQEMVQEYDGRRRLMVKGFNDLGLPCLMPKGAFYAFPSIASTGLTSDEFTERLLMEEHVVVVPGATFGEQGEGHVRCCYANSLKNIEEALHRIDRFVARYRA